MKKIFMILLALFFITPQTSAVNKKVSTAENNQIESITVDCAFSVGGWCICAKHLQSNNLRRTASPLDWMRFYSLDTAAHFFETKFKDFFENIEVTCERIKSNGNRKVYDTKNHIESIHYMHADITFDQAYKEFKETMGRRAQKVDKILSTSKSVLLVNCREDNEGYGQNSTDQELKNFAVRFAKSYPNLKKIYLIDIHNDKNEGIKKRMIHSGKKIKIIQYKFKNVDKNNSKDRWTGNRAAWNKILKNIRLTDTVKEEDGLRATLF